MATTNTKAVTSQQSQPQPETAPPVAPAQNLQREIEQLREENLRLKLDVDGLRERLRSEPIQAMQVQTLRRAPQVIPLSDGKRIVMSHVASYGPNADGAAIEFRSADGKVLGFEEAPKHEDRGPHGKEIIPQERRLEVAAKMLRSVDELFAFEAD